MAVPDLRRTNQITQWCLNTLTSEIRTDQTGDSTGSDWYRIRLIGDSASQAVPKHNVDGIIGSIVPAKRRGQSHVKSKSRFQVPFSKPLWQKCKGPLEKGASLRKDHAAMLKPGFPSLLSGLFFLILDTCLTNS